ncbi:MAG: regulatory protein [Gemmatimonadetes bacterium]|jgi:AraC family transcriptional regulator of adaptative response / DNA-3-methyladenine glycosylase II|nr:regulatory protein [Gemmatimonadota bacterium]
MRLDQDICTRALEARDARFDGVFFVGITSTGIYCRPICPARATLRKNRRFFSNAAAAERAGFRPCLRCRPELAPGFARIDAVPRLAQSAARRIASGEMNGHGVDGLALSLGVSARQLRRALQQELGVTPIELAQTHRLLLAKQLLTDTPLPISQVAYASGFQSLRRFNALFLERYRLNPQTMRRRVGARSSDSALQVVDGVRLALSYRPPLAWDALLAFLAARGAPAVECIQDGRYARTLNVGGHAGVIRVSRPRVRAEHEGEGSAAALPVLHLDVSATLLPVLLAVSARVRRLFDLDAEPEKIASHLASSGFGPIRGEARGLRVPGTADSFELAIRAILGQQVSVKGASTLMSRLTETFGTPMQTDHPQLTRLAATAERIAQATPAAIAKIGLPLARATTIHLLATRVAEDSLVIEPEADVRALTRQLLDLPGIGPWTAEYIVMRAVHWPDAFPASDLVLRRSAGNLSSAKLLRAAEEWRPWRAYAAMHLWSRS